MAPKAASGAEDHDDAHDAHQDLEEHLEQMKGRLGLFAQLRGGDAAQHGDQEDLQDFAGGERADESRRNDIQQGNRRP
ncbi:MAG: hypothetical protein WDM96_12955 [Lacunisphaera sp.]